MFIFRNWIRSGCLNTRKSAYLETGFKTTTMAKLKTGGKRLIINWFKLTLDFPSHSSGKND